MKHVALLVAVALASSGCSWAFSRQPPKGAECGGRLYAPPIIDTQQAVTSGAVGLLALSQASVGEHSSDTFEILALAYGAYAAVMGASAYYGWNQLKTCRKRYETPPRRWVTPSMFALTTGSDSPSS